MIGRLKGVNEIIAFKMLGQLKEDNLFSDLGKEGQVGDRPIVLYIFSVKRGFFCSPETGVGQNQSTNNAGEK